MPGRATDGGGAELNAPAQATNGAAPHFLGRDGRPQGAGPVRGEP